MMVKIKKILLLLKKYINPGTKFFIRILKSVSWNGLAVNGVYGIKDSYYNGLIYGTLSAVSPIFSRKIRVNLDPVFNENIFRGNANMSVSIHIYKILAAAVIFLTSVLWIKIKG